MLRIVCVCSALYTDRAWSGADAVLTTGPIAFAATQHALGALEFLPRMDMLKPINALGGPSGCLNGTYVTMTLKDLYLRQLRCASFPPALNLLVHWVRLS